MTFTSHIVTPAADPGVGSRRRTSASSATFTPIEFLWLNVVGAVAVTVIGLTVSSLTGGRRPEAA
jgi:hypothetical protein